MTNENTERIALLEHNLRLKREWHDDLKTKIATLKDQQDRLIKSLVAGDNCPSGFSLLNHDCSYQTCEDCWRQWLKGTR